MLKVKNLTLYLFRALRKNAGMLLLKPAYQLLYKTKYKFVAPENKFISIKINEIEGWYRGNRYGEFTFPGIIKGGDWSSKITPKKEIFKNSLKFKSIVQRYKNGCPWIETEIFKENYVPLINKGIKVKGFSDLENLSNHYQTKYDELFFDLESNGFSTGINIFPVYVHIYKNGEILYTVEGNHRLFMCMVLGIEEIPVKVWCRHKEWQLIREKIIGGEIVNSNLGIDRYLCHPDIQGEL